MQTFKSVQKRNRNSSLEQCFRPQQSHEEEFNSMTPAGLPAAKVYPKPCIPKREAIFWNIFGKPQKVNKNGCLCLLTEASWLMHSLWFPYNADQGSELKRGIATFSTFTVLLEILIKCRQNNFTKCLACLYPHVDLGGSSQYVKYLKITTPRGTWVAQ